jgi:integrase
MPFEEAFAEWMRRQTGVSEVSAGRVRRWDESTIERYGRYGAAFSLMYGRVPLRELSDGHLNEYMEARAACSGAWSAPAGQCVIRKETDMAVRVLRDADLWTDALKKAYERIRLPMIESDDQRALSPEQMVALMRALRRKPEDSRWVLYDSVIALHTCAGTNERRMARMRHVMLARRLFHVGPEQSKNKYRNRDIPLETDEVMFAFEWMLRQAKERGATKPDHFLYPKRRDAGPAASGLMLRYDRAELYEKVWTQPVRKAAEAYGLSDVGLAKICRSLEVPLPGRGYWNKRAAGRPVPLRPPLGAIDVTGELYDPTQPMTRWCLSQQFEGVGEEIGVDDLTPYDLRHTAMSRMAEVGTPIDIILAFGGQVSEKMRRHYTTVSMFAKRGAQQPAWASVKLLEHHTPMAPLPPPPSAPRKAPASVAEAMPMWRSA